MSAPLRGMTSVPPPTDLSEHELSVADLPVSSDPERLRTDEVLVTELKVAPKKRSSRRAPSATQRPAPGEVVIGKFVGLTEAGVPLVDHPLNTSGSPLASRTTVPLGPDRLGHDVVLGFEGGDARLPIVLGIVWQPTEPERPAALPEAKVDDEQLVFSAEKEIVLRCGEASITLTRAGKVLIRGTYLLSRSSGVNRIKGGSVQIN